jgi:hypothetical protein
MSGLDARLCDSRPCAYFPACSDLTEAIMRPALSCAVTVAFLLSAPLAAAKTAAVSWGKAGVSIDQYRTDSITCGRAGYYMDVSNTEAAHVFKDATGQLTANEAGLSGVAMVAADGPPPERVVATMEVADIANRSSHIVESTRPKKRMKDVGALMQSKVDDCLKERGYTRFKLTSIQRKLLGKLHLGSAERHVFLYKLGTDPAVLKTQAF